MSTKDWKIAALVLGTLWLSCITVGALEIYVLKPRCLSTPHWLNMFAFLAFVPTGFTFIFSFGFWQVSAFADNA